MPRRSIPSVHNHHEQAVFDLVEAEAARQPEFAGAPDLLADVACVALNALPPRYIRHSIDMNFYMTDQERHAIESTVSAAVYSAFAFVRSRMGKRSAG